MGVGGALFLAFGPSVLQGFEAGLVVVLAGGLCAFATWLYFSEVLASASPKKRWWSLVSLGFVSAALFVGALGWVLVADFSETSSSSAGATASVAAQPALGSTPGEPQARHSRGKLDGMGAVAKPASGPASEQGGEVATPAVEVSAAAPTPDEDEKLTREFRISMIERQIRNYDSEASRLYNSMATYATDQTTYTIRADMEKWERDVAAFLTRNYPSTSVEMFKAFSGRYSESYPDASWRNKEAVRARSHALNRMREKRERFAEAVLAEPTI